jgi:hypothetical protein
MAAELDLDEQASADWMLVPERPQDGVIYGGQSRAFESVRNAIRFVMEKIPSHQRATAHVRTDSGHTYRFDEIVRIYRAQLSAARDPRVSRNE